MADVEVTRPSYYHPLGKIGSRFGRSKGKKESKKRDQNELPSKGPNGALPAVAAPTQGESPTLQNAVLLHHQGLHHHSDERPVHGVPLSLPRPRPLTTANALAAHPALQPMTPMTPTKGSNRSRGSVQEPPAALSREESPHPPAALHHAPLPPVHAPPHGSPHAHHHAPVAPHGSPVVYQRHHPPQHPQPHAPQKHQSHVVRLSRGDPNAMPHHSAHGHGAGGRPSHLEHSLHCSLQPAQIHHEAYADPLRNSYLGSSGAPSGSMQRLSHGPLHPLPHASHQNRHLPAAPGDVYRHQPRDDSSLHGSTTGGPVVTRPIFARDESLSSFCEEDAMSRSSRSCQTRQYMESYHNAPHGLNQRAAHGGADPLRHSYHGVGSESNAMLHRHDAVPLRALYRQDSSQRNTKDRHRCSSKESSLLGVLSNNHHSGDSGLGDHSQRSTRSSQSRRSMNGPSTLTTAPSLLGHVNDMDHRSDVSSSIQMDPSVRSQRAQRRESIGAPTPCHANDVDDRPVVSLTTGSRGSNTSSARPQRVMRRASLGAPMHQVDVSDDQSDASSISRESLASQSARPQRSPLLRNLDPHGINAAHQSQSKPRAYARSLSGPYDGRLADRGPESARVCPTNQRPASPNKNQYSNGRPGVDANGICVRPANHGPSSPYKNQRNMDRPIVGSDGIRMHETVPLRELYRQYSSQRSIKEHHRYSSKESSLLGLLHNNHHSGEPGLGDHSQRSTRTSQSRRSTAAPSLLGHVNNTDHHSVVSSAIQIDSSHRSHRTERRASIGTPTPCHANDLDDRSFVSLTTGSRGSNTSSARPQRVMRRASLGAPMHQVHVSDDQSDASSISRESLASQSARPQRSPLLGHLDPHGNNPANQSPPKHHAYARSLSDPYDGRVTDRRPQNGPVAGDGIRPANQGPASPKKNHGSNGRPGLESDGIRVCPTNQGPASPYKNQSGNSRPGVVDDGIWAREVNHGPSSPYKNQRNIGNQGSDSPGKNLNYVGRPRVDGDGIRVRPGNQGPSSPYRTNTGRPMDSDGIHFHAEVSSPHKSQHDKVQATLESDQIRVRPVGPKRTDSDMQSAGIYPETLRSPKRDVRPLVGTRTSLPRAPLDMDGGNGANPANVVGMSERVERPIQSTRPRVDRDGIHVYSEAETLYSPQRGRSNVPADTMQARTQARPLMEHNTPSPFDQSDESKRARSHSGGRLIHHDVKVSLDKKSSHNLTSSPPQRPRTWV